MVLCYTECGNVLLSAQALFLERYGRRPSLQTILGAVQRRLDYGVYMPPAADGGRQRVSARIEDDILDFFMRHPMASTGDAARVFNVGRMTVWRLLRDEGLYPYHFTRVQELKPLDLPPRVEFCRWLLQDPTRSILWTDESTFTRVGLFNIHNAHWWTTENPHVVKPDHFQTRFSVNVWAGLIGDRLLGPVFLDRLNGQTYLEFLTGVLATMLEDIPLIYLRTMSMYWQHDGAPAHYDRRVREYLSNEYGNRWIGRGGPVPWPARSPDLTPLDFHVWGRAKDLVYGNDGHTISSAEQLKLRIVNAFAVMASDRETLLKVQRHIIKRAAVCVEQQGGYVQQLV